MLTDGEVRKAAQLLINRYGVSKAHDAAAFRCLELTAMGEIDAALQWQAIADALKALQQRSDGNREAKGLRLVG
ncbi:MAG TPA: hypothetical protein VE914_07775 [Candidatus Angelobacter sp.]|nr:hypothetical protein [Candidatus Angelobacter sp.]